MLLLRHGQSEWNALRRWQGTADPPLTALGRRQARTTADVLVRLGVSFAGVWASDLQRAEATASILSRRLGVGPVVTDPRLREAHAGEWEGLTPDEIDRKWPGYLADHRRPPRFEPFPDVVRRVTDAIRDVIASLDDSPDGAAGTALVVAHSGVIRSLIRHLGAVDGRIPNMGGVWLGVAEPSPASSATLRLDPGDDRPELILGDVFDPDGVVVSGVDAPGEDPGDQSDDADADGAEQR